VPFRRVVFIAFFAIFVVLAPAKLSSLAVYAGIDFQPVSQEELKMTSEPLAPGASAIILYREVDRDDSASTIHEDNYYRIKVLTEAGRQYANIEIPFVKDVDQVTHIRARTIKPDGTVVDFNDKVMDKSLAKFHRWNYLAKIFTMPSVEPGCILEYSYTLNLEHAYASHWILSEDMFTKAAHFSIKPYSGGRVPLILRRTWQNLPPGAEIKQDPDTRIHMEAVNIPAFQTEDFMPPPNELKSRVDFDYEPASGDRDPEEFWKRIGKARNLYLENFIGKRKAMEEAVAQIVSPNDTPEVKLHKIYERVQRLHNTSFDLQKTEQEKKREKEKSDENVEDVWKRGYGSSWQLDFLFLALVRAAGFEAYGCALSSRAEYFFKPKTMQSGHLNETAILVKLDGKDLYFNPGSDFAPFGLLNWSETNTPGLRLDKDGGTWIKTRLPASSESRVERRANFKLSDTGDLEGKVTITYTGLEAMYHRVDVRHSDELARKKFLEDRVKIALPATAEAELINQPDWSGSETPLTAEFNVKITGWASNAGRRVLIPAGVFTASEKHTFEHSERTHPIYSEYCYQKADDVTIDLPDGWRVDSVPAEQKNDGHIIAYDLKVENANSALHLTRKLSIDFMLLDAKYYPALRAFFQSVRTGDEQQVVLLPPTPKEN
jgi:hypothetical protein